MPHVLSTVFCGAAILAFGVATCVDWPSSTGPRHAERMVGNFCCSLGFLCLALAVYFS